MHVPEKAKSPDEEPKIDDDDKETEVKQPPVSQKTRKTPDTLVQLMDETADDEEDINDEENENEPFENEQSEA